MSESPSLQPNNQDLENEMHQTQLYDQAQEFAENPKIEAANEEIAHIEKEYEGAYSNIGTYDPDFRREDGKKGGFKGGRTYKLDEEGKARVVTRAEANAKAEELESLKAIVVGEGAAADTGAPAPETTPDIDELRVKDYVHRAFIDEYVKSWSQAEANGDELGVKRVLTQLEAVLEEHVQNGLLTDAEKNKIADALNEKSYNLTKELRISKERASFSENINVLTEKWAIAEANEKDDDMITVQDEILNQLIDNKDLTEDEKMVLIDTICSDKDRIKTERAELMTRLRDVMDRKLNADSLDVRDLTDDEIAQDGDLEVRDLTDEEILADQLSELKLPHALQVRLDSARKDFINLNAKRRGVSFGYKKQLAHAKEAYDKIRNEAGAAIVEKMKELGATDEMISAFSKQGSLLEISNLTKGIERAQLMAADGKRLKGFYDWWARQGTNGNFKGKLKKAAVIGAVGFVPGVGLGMVGAAVLGPVAGGLIGGAIAKGVGKGLAGAKVSKEANARTVAGAQRVTQENYANWKANHVDSGNLTSEDISSIIENTTAKENSRNKRRMVGSIAVGAVAGVGGALVGNMVADQFMGGGSSDTGNQVAPETPDAPAEVPVVPVEATLPPVLPSNFSLDAMPLTNAVEAFHSPNPNELVQNTLNEYNARSGANFVWNHNDGMFWDGGRVINPDELRIYNQIMSELATS